MLLCILCWWNQSADWLISTGAGGFVKMSCQLRQQVYHPVITCLLSYSDSEGQEKYLRELSITPVGYFTGAIKNHFCAVSHRNYFAWRK
jgi:hypothetical protein